MKDYILELPSFEGPLDLLLHFVHTNELDIRHLPIAPICKQYLEFLRACEEVDITLSSEWLAMAARLIYIKSCTLLPGSMLEEAPGTESFWTDTPDPRQELIRELLERERLLAIRKTLPVLRVAESRTLDSYTRFDLGEPETDKQYSWSLGELSIHDLLDLYRSTLLRKQSEKSLEITVRHLRLGEVIKEILSRFLPKGTRKFFASLLPPKFSLHQSVMTFLAILELAKSGRVYLHQHDPFTELEIERIA